jgi:hypothetical protein
VKVFKGRRHGFMPTYLRHAVTREADWREQILPLLSPVTPQRWEGFEQVVAPAEAAQRQGRMIIQSCIGGYMYLRALVGPEEICYMLVDDPGLVHQMMRAWLELADAWTARVQQRVEPDVLYLSTHQSGIYPGSGHLDDTGQGIGKGTVVNIPLPAGVGHLAFAAIAEQVIVPLAERFAPEFVLVSAGFDSHWRDTLAGMQLTCHDYYDLALSLVDIARRHCGGRLVFVLEGGYDPEALAGSVQAVLFALAGEPRPRDPLGPAPYTPPDIGPLLQNVIAIHGL